MRKYLICLGLCFIIYPVVFVIINQLDIVMEWIRDYKIITVIVFGIGAAFIMEWSTKIDNKLKLRHEQREC